MKEDFARELQRLRIKHFFTQREFARRLHIDKSTYNAWEKNKRFPLPQSMKAVADFYAAMGEDITKLLELYRNNKEG